ncbi:hypothetical protein CDAR_15481 [Caerostris darwini]|uniref:Uncharacterized protein n=1 Tax=Caerostris darwini TaxID=1538125 RepID=A0AAV4PXT3_9ARAC|nr:hypothetical protein CDAR_15481 [Caerostris darwini]
MIILSGLDEIALETGFCAIRRHERSSERQGGHELIIRGEEILPRMIILSGLDEIALETRFCAIRRHERSSERQEP